MDVVNRYFFMGNVDLEDIFSVGVVSCLLWCKKMGLVMVLFIEEKDNFMVIKICWYGYSIS